MNLRDLLSKNIYLKITASIFAVVIWINAMTDRTVQEPVNVPVRFVGLPESMVVTDVNYDSVSVIIEGKRKDFILMKILGDNPYIEVNVKDIEMNNFQMNIDNTVFNLPFSDNMRIVKIKHPQYIKVAVDSLKQKEVTIMPVISGSPADGYSMFGEIAVFPPKANISGGKRLLEKISYINTEQIDIGNTKRNLKRTVGLVNDKKFIDVDLKSVKVTIMLDKTVSRTFTDVPVVLVNKSKGITLKPDSFSFNATLSGPNRIMKDIFSGELSPIIDVSYIKKPGRYPVPVSLSLQKNIRVIDIDPDTFYVEAR